MDDQPVLVGRERERAAMRSVVSRASFGEPALVLVHGEAGIGKTSLVREVASPPLTKREREVLDGLLSGETYAQIAVRLFISDKTVSSHVSSVLRKTGTASRIELAELARRCRSDSGG